MGSVEKTETRSHFMLSSLNVHIFFFGYLTRDDGTVPLNPKYTVSRPHPMLCSTSFATLHTQSSSSFTTLSTGGPCLVASGDSMDARASHRTMRTAPVASRAQP